MKKKNKNHGRPHKEAKDSEKEAIVAETTRLETEGKETRKTELEKQNTWKSHKEAKEAETEAIVAETTRLETEGKENRETELEKQNSWKAEKEATEAQIKRLETEGKEARKTIIAQSEADLARLELQLQIEQAKTPMKQPVTDETAHPPIVPPSPAIQQIANQRVSFQIPARSARKLPSKTPLPSTAKKSNRGIQYETFTDFYWGEGVSKKIMPTPPVFEPHLAGVCNANMLFNDTAAPRVVVLETEKDEKVKALVQIWVCDCGGVRLRIVKDPTDETHFFIQRHKSLNCHVNGQPLEAAPN